MDNDLNAWEELAQKQMLDGHLVPLELIRLPKSEPSHWSEETIHRLKAAEPLDLQFVSLSCIEVRPPPLASQLQD